MILTPNRIGRDPLVSFLIPHFNYNHFLADCLSGIAHQSRQVPIEIIIVDDGSEVDPKPVIKNFASLPIKLVRHSRNLGLIASLEDGFERCKGRYIARIDPDDRYRPNFLDATLSAFDQYPEAGLVYGNVALIDHTGRVTQSAIDDRAGEPSKRSQLMNLLKLHSIASPSVLSLRAAWKAALPFPSRLQSSALDDWYLEVMIAREFDFVHIPQIVADYRVHANNFHSRSTLSRSDEQFVSWFLDRVFAEKEVSSNLEASKQGQRGAIYGRQYFTLAQKYFGAGMFDDARRCYLQTLKHQPRYGLNPEFIRQLIATAIGPGPYGKLKRLVQNRRVRPEDRARQ